MHTLRHMWSIFRIHMGHTCGIYFLIDTLGTHTHSVCHGAHSHLHMLGTGRVHTYTLEACLCKFGHTWMHIKQLHSHICVEYTEMHTQIYSYPWAHTPKDLNKQPLHLEIHLNTSMGHTHRPHTSLWDTFWWTHGIPKTSQLSQSFKEAQEGTGPIWWGLYQFALRLYPWNQTSRSSKLRNKMDTQGGMCYSRLHHSNRT